MNAPTIFDRVVTGWLEADAPSGAPAGLHDSVIERARTMRQRPRLMVAIRAGTRLGRRDDGGASRRTWLLLAAALAVGTTIIGAAIVGGLIGPKPGPTAPVVVTNPTPDHATDHATPSQAPSETSPVVQPKPAIFVFNKGAGSAAECGNSTRGGCIGRLWVASLDGSGAHELVPDQSGCQRFQAWSPEGTRLLFSRSQCKWTEEGMFGAERFYLTDRSGSEPQLVDTGCVSPCQAEDDAVFSSDGGRILFVRTKGIPPAPSATDPVTGKPAQGTEVWVLASIDLATGRVTELGPYDECFRCGTEWTRSYPRWSPDRTQIVFTEAAQVPIGPQPPKDPAVFVADADARNVHTLSLSGQFPAWSPDGSRIVFQRDRYTWTGTWRPGTVVRLFTDIYTIRPDGTDLRRLTTDQVSSNPGWSVDGRIWFIRTPRVDGHVSADEAWQDWIMDADGANAAQSSLPPQPQDYAGTVRQPTP